MFAAIDSTDTAMIVIILVLLLVLVFLGLAEMGMSRITKLRAQSLADSGDKRGTVLARLVGEPERFVNPILLTVNICQTVQATLTGIVASSFGAWGVLIGVLLNVLVFFVLAESLPKTWAVLNPEKAALMAARPVSALVSFWPLRMASKALIGLTNLIIPGKGLAEGPFVSVSERELRAMVDAAADEAVIERSERELIESVFTFGDTLVREIMVPRPDIVSVDAETSLDEALDIALANGNSRVPVSEGDLDSVVGLAYTKDLMRAVRDGRGDAAVRELARPAVFTPETKPVAELMRQMQANKFHLALLVDEYGSISGLVTLEDCIEELIGDIVDEHDDEDAEIEQLPDGEVRLDGGISIDEVNELLSIELPDDDWDTLGGYIFNTLGHVPEVGETVFFAGHQFAVEEMDSRRIAQVRVTPMQEPVAVAVAVVEAEPEDQGAGA
jgi:putative hemolysin